MPRSLYYQINDPGDGGENVLPCRSNKGGS